MMTHEPLQHIFWIGGSPCAGKSTTADRLAAEHDLVVYRCDDSWERHALLADAVRTPLLHRLARADCDGLWMRPVAQQVEEELVAYREEFAFIFDDLRQLPTDRPILAEGCALLPELLVALGVPANRSIWIVPTPTFQLTHYSQRDWIGGTVATCTSQEQAWQNWMARDIGFAGAVSVSARDLNRAVITVDGSAPIDAIYSQVVHHFGLAPTRQMS